MILKYANKMSEEEIYENIKTCDFKFINGSQDAINKLIFGENLKVLKTLIKNYDLEGKVDLVYIDPPFSTKNVFKMSESRANTISASHSDSIAYSDTLTGSDYVEFIRERLVLLKKVMSNEASIYFHIDYKIGHYVKIAMDEIFGINNFKNDITRIKCNPKNFKRRSYGNIKDMILFYTKTKNYTWNDPRVPLTSEDIKRLFKKIDDKGRRYTTIPLHAPGETKNGPTGQKWKGMYPPKGRHWRSDPKKLDELDAKGLVEWSSNGVPRKIIYAHEKKLEGMKLQDIWKYKDKQYPSYPTEKNQELLERIISTSSNPNDLILDCFCGSGTTLAAAQKLGRHWIGIDNSKNAIKVTRKKIEEITSESQKTLYSDDIFACYKCTT